MPGVYFMGGAVCNCSTQDIDITYYNGFYYGTRAAQDSCYVGRCAAEGGKLLYDCRAEGLDGNDLIWDIGVPGTLDSTGENACCFVPPPPPTDDNACADSCAVTHAYSASDAD